MVVASSFRATPAAASATLIVSLASQQQRLPEQPADLRVAWLAPLAVSALPADTPSVAHSSAFAASCTLQWSLRHASKAQMPGFQSRDVCSLLHPEVWLFP